MLMVDDKLYQFVLQKNMTTVLLVCNIRKVLNFV